MSRFKLLGRRRFALWVGLVFLAGFATGLAGCRTPLDEGRDKITTGAGDAVAHNKAVQTRDPYPAEAGSTRWGTNGERMKKAIETYEEGPKEDPTGGSSGGTTGNP